MSQKQKERYVVLENDQRAAGTTAYEFLLQRISISLQRKNAKCNLGTFNDAGVLEKKFYAIF